MGPAGIREWLTSDAVLGVIASAAGLPRATLASLGRPEADDTSLSDEQASALAVAVALAEEVAQRAQRLAEELFEERAEARVQELYEAMLGAEYRMGVVTGLGEAVTYLLRAADSQRHLGDPWSARAIDEAASQLRGQQHAEQAGRAVAS